MSKLTFAMAACAMSLFGSAGGLVANDELAHEQIFSEQFADAQIELVSVSDAPAAVQQEAQSAVSAGAAKTGTGTSLLDLLSALKVYAPQIIQAQARSEAVQAQQLVAAGGFDSILSGSYSGRMTGFYGGQVADVAVKQRLRGINAEVYSGYSISSGRLPVYEDEYLTNDVGELRIGAKFALLRGRETDPVRTAESNARLKAAAAIQAATAETISITASAMKAYVDWLYAENVRTVYEELLQIAQVRDDAIAKAVDAGQLATITKQENRQLLLARQGQTVNAAQKAMEQAVYLSVYLRDQNGNPMAPVYGQQTGVPQQNPFTVYTQAEVLRRTLDERPDIVSLRLELDALMANEALAENDTQPDLDLIYEARRDFGDGSITRAGTDHKVGLNLSMPIQFSAARGALAAARAEIKAARAELRLRRDRVALALQASQAALVATEQQLAIGAAEVDVANRLRTAEETRYLAGASDVFRLNAQETALANSKLRVLSAQRNHDLLLVDYYLTTGTLWF